MSFAADLVKIEYSQTSMLVVSIGLFWFYFVSFLYNGVYFKRFIFNCTLAQYQNAHSFWATFLSAEKHIFAQSELVKG